MNIGVCECGALVWEASGTRQEGTLLREKKNKTKKHIE